MKKKLLISILMLSIIGTMSLVGCSKDDNNNNTNINQSENNLEDSNKDTLSNIDDEKKGEDNKESAVLRLYYYDANSDMNYYIDSSIDVKDKAIVKSLIAALKAIPAEASIDDVKDNIMLLPKNIEVTSAKVNNDLDTLTVDFNSNISEGLGSTGEKSLIYTIVNTLGYNLKVSNVEITINGKPYSSGHIVQEKGEAFPVSITNTILLEK